MLKKEQPIGEIFTIVDRISSAGITLNQTTLENQRKAFNQTYSLDIGPYISIDLRTFLDESQGTNLWSLKGEWTGYSADNAKPLLEGMLANAVLLQLAGDLLTESGVTNALSVANERYRERGLGIFTAFEAFDQKVITGSHVKAKGFNFVGGPTANYDTPLGLLLAGAFVEIGAADFDTVDNYRTYLTSGPQVGKPSGGYDVLGEGKTEYLGGGVLLRHDFHQGYYVEASVKGGRYTTEFAIPEKGPDVGFRVESNYWALHGGLGYRFEYRPGMMMDAYGKIYLTKFGGEDLITNDGYKVGFADAKFLRARLGVRYTIRLLDSLGLVAGGAWNYNFGDNYGHFKGKVGDNDIPIVLGEEPSLKGSSGTLELGLEYKPLADLGLSLALSGKAFLGKTLGGSGDLVVKYVFGGPRYAGPRDDPNPPSSGAFSGNAPIARGPVNSSAPIRLAQAGDEYDSEEDVGEDSSASLGTITVYSEPQWKQILSPGAVSVVVPDDYLGEQKNLAGLLDLVPGLHVNRRGGGGQYTTVNVRGSTAAQVAVFVDGVPQNLGGDPAVDISLYTSENVERVEVYKGYVPVRFVGAPLGGVINIVTKKPTKFGTALKAGVRSFHGFQANGLFTFPLLGGSTLFSATRDQSRGDFPYKYWQPLVNLPTARSDLYRHRMNNSHQKSDVSVKWQTARLSIQGSWSEMDRYYPFTTNVATATNLDLVDLDDDPWGVNRRNHQLVIDRDLTLGLREDFGNLNVGVEFNYRTQAKTFEWEDHPPRAHPSWGHSPKPGDAWSVYVTDRWGVVLDAAYKLGERNMLEFRGSLVKEKLSMDGSEWQFPSVDSTSVIKMGTVYEREMTDLQLQDTITLDDDLWLTFIARAARVLATGIDLTTYSSTDPDNMKLRSHYSEGFPTDDGKWNYSWGVAVKKNFNEHWTVKTTGGTFIRYPNFYELFGDGVYIKPALFFYSDDPLPQPEKGEQWDFTVEWRGAVPMVDASANLSTSLFYRRTENMIGLFQTPQHVYYGNYGKTRATGVEMEGQVKSALLDLSFSATYLEAKNIDIIAREGGSIPYKNSTSEGMPLLNSPKWETTVRGDFRVPWVDGLTIFAEHHYTDKVPIQYHANGVSYEEELATVNTGLKIEIFEGVQLTAGVNDVFNKTIEQGYYRSETLYTTAHGPTSTLYFPKEGRSSYITIDAKF
jgi:outer membrane receptor protein involved in Fe transport